MCEAVCDVGGVTVSKAVKLSVLPSDAEEDIDFLVTEVLYLPRLRWWEWQMESLSRLVDQGKL